MTDFTYLDDELKDYRAKLWVRFTDLYHETRKKKRRKENGLLDWISDMYEKLRKQALRMFLRIGRHYYKKAGGEEDAVTEDWILLLMDEFDPVEKYKFNDEFERKKYRTFEAIWSSLIAKESPEKSIKTSRSLLNKQVSEKAVRVADMAELTAWEEIGVHHVQWIAHMDNRTCEECADRHLKIYTLDALPARPHYGCRCHIKVVD